MSTAAAAVAFSDRFLPEGAAPARAAILAEARGREAAWITERLASLPRRVGRGPGSGGGIVAAAGGSVDAGTFRTCDLVAAELLAGSAASWSVPGRLLDVYSHGDAEERRMILKSLPLLGLPAAVSVRLLEEAHRTNDQTVFEAGLLDSDLPARVLPEDGWNRIVLKIAFLDLPARRLLGFERRRNPTLSRMLQEFRREREAAGRKVWADTAAMVST